MTKEIYNNHGLIVTQFAGFGGMSRFQFTVTEESGYMDMSIEESQDLIKKLVEASR